MTHPSIKPCPFDVGDMVTWTSQSGGYAKTKTGEVVVIVPPRQRADRHVPVWASLPYPGLSRDHESYLVRVGTSRRLYWPRVSHLKAAKP